MPSRNSIRLLLTGVCARVNVALIPLIDPDGTSLKLICKAVEFIEVAFSAPPIPTPPLTTNAPVVVEVEAVVCRKVKVPEIVGVKVE
jgi:hypothetical protein